MAGPAPPLQQAARPGHSRVVRCIALVFLALIVIVGLAVLITYLAIKPKRLIYTVENASLPNFNLSKGQLNSNFDFIVRSYNPNSKVSIYYDSIHVTVAFSDQTLAYGDIQPFYQPHRNVTRLDVYMTAQSVKLFDSVSKDLALEKSAGEINLDVWIKARIRFKVGVWKSRDRTLRISCTPVVVFISRPKSFQRTKCYTEL